MKAYGRIDILVNSAGVGYSWMEKSPGSMSDIVDTTPEKWREVMALNLDSTFYMCRLVIPQMKAQGGGFPVTAVLLIAVGILFLLHNLEIIRLYQLLRYWPVFLIVLGAYMLYIRVTDVTPAVAPREAPNERQ